MAMSEQTQLRLEAQSALYQEIKEEVGRGQNPEGLRKLAEAYALVSGTFTGGPKVDVKS